MIKDTRGYSLVEMLVSLAILGVLISGISSFSVWSLRFTETEANRSRRNVENFEASKMLSQPSYFGSISRLPGNEKLNVCTSDDGATCDATKEFEIKLYDPSGAKEIALVSTDLSDRIKNKVLVRPHCLNNKSSCDKASYYTVTVQTFLSYAEATFAPISRSIIVEPVFNNVITFIPDAKVAVGRPVNVFIFIDNSNSMVFAKDQIKAGVDDLVNRLSEMDVTLGVYDLGARYFSSWESYYIDSAGSKKTVRYIQDAPPDITEAFEEATYLTIPESWNSSDYQKVIFRKRMTAEERRNSLEMVKNFIEAKFSNSFFAQQDYPFCNLIRILETEKSRNPYAIDKTTPTLIYLISNEDDQSNIADCTKSYTSRYKLEKNFYKGRPTTYMAGARKQEVSVSFEFMGVLDGAPYSFTGSVTIKAQYSSDISKSTCKNFVATIPWKKYIDEAYLKGKYGYKPGSGYNFSSCDVTYPRYGLGYQSFAAVRNTNQEAEADCARFVKEFDSLTYFKENGYDPGSCLVQVTEGTKDVEVKSWRYQGNVGGPSSYIGSDGAVVAVYNSIKNKIGLENTYYIPVVHTDKTTCNMSLGARVGTNYLSLAKMPKLKSTSIPVCSSNYANNLSDFSTWTESFGLNDIELPASVLKNMSGIEVIKSDKSVQTVVANVDYQIIGNALIFRPGLISTSDIIKVYLK